MATKSGQCLSGAGEAARSGRLLPPGTGTEARLCRGHDNLASAVWDQGKWDEARACCQRALELKPDLAEALNRMGVILDEEGEVEAARASWRKVLWNDPRNVTALAQLATSLRDRLPEADEAAIRELLSGPRLPDQSRVSLEFALAQVLDARRAYEEAAEHFGRASTLQLADLQRRGLEYHAAEERRFADAVIATFTPEFFARVRGFGLETELPVFIIGLPRSGTSLVEQILASHSRVFGAGELQLYSEVFAALPKAMRRNATPFECLPHIDRRVTRRLAAQVLERLRAFDSGALRIVDKFPANYVYLGLIGVLFPQAKVIHCRRDLRDVALSCWTTNFALIHWACDPDRIASRFEDHRRLMEHWRKVLPMPFLEVDYESVVGDLEGNARRIIQWCGLEWEPQCLEFYKTRRAVHTASAVQVRQPIYRSSVGRWKNYEKLLGPLFARLSDD